MTPQQHAKLHSNLDMWQSKNPYHSFKDWPNWSAYNIAFGKLFNEKQSHLTREQYIAGYIWDGKKAVNKSAQLLLWEVE